MSLKVVRVIVSGFLALQRQGHHFLMRMFGKGIATPLDPTAAGGPRPLSM